MTVFLNYYIKVVLVILAILTAYIVFAEKKLWKQVALLVFAMILLPYQSADYKLLYIFFPLYLFINTNEKAKSDLYYSLMFALLLIPKAYYFFPNIKSDSGTSDISISVLMNPLIILAMSLVIISSSLKSRSIMNKFKRTAISAFNWFRNN